jgi:CRISPR-associated endoribonuclease Cas6
MDAENSDKPSTLNTKPQLSSKDLVGIRLELHAVHSGEILPQYTTGLHAWFLEQVRKTNPELSQYLHDGESEKPFTISRLEGVKWEAGKKIKILINQPYYWTITALNSDLVKWLKQWLKHPPNVVRLRDIYLKIVSITTVYPSITYQELLQTPMEKTLALSFVSPTSFRRKGNHFPLPLPFNVFQSYLRRWNNFANYPVETESFLQWIDEQVIILRHQIHTLKITGGKSGSVTGFVGAVEYGLSTEARKNEEYVQLFFALGKLAPYCGTGHKTPFGLGQTRCGWLLESETFKTTTIEILLAQRIEQVSEILMNNHGQKPGANTLRICETRATILARQEFGESLQDIAQDMEMPYETVKTYAKLVRKLLKES